MNVELLQLPGVALITPLAHQDVRGEFTELLPIVAPELELLNVHFPQVNLSHSRPGVIRGLHYQLDPLQGKLVSCVEGRILDVVADIRSGSETFGRHLAVELDSSHRQLLWIPGGYAHGFAVVGDRPATIVYWVDARFNPRTEGGVAWNDPTLAISWPIDAPILSERDRGLPMLSARPLGV